MWAGEELCAVGKDSGDGIGAYAVVFEVDEAGGLEAFEDGCGGRLLRRGVIGEEGRKVNELSHIREKHIAEGW